MLNIHVYKNKLKVPRHGYGKAETLNFNILFCELV